MSSNGISVRDDSVPTYESVKRKSLASHDASDQLLRKEGSQRFGIFTGIQLGGLCLGALLAIIFGAIELGPVNAGVPVYPEANTMMALTCFIAAMWVFEVCFPARPPLVHAINRFQQSLSWSGRSFRWRSAVCFPS